MTAAMENEMNQIGRYVDAQAPSPRGMFTERISALMENAENTRHRLQLVLNHLRVAPPSAIEKAESQVGRQTCVEDYLQRAESANASISGLLNELEGLFQ